IARRNLREARCCPQAPLASGIATARRQSGLDTTDQRAAKVRPVREGLRAVAQANNLVGVELYRRLAQQRNNQFLSPASIFAGLATVIDGTAGETRAQMASASHFDPVDARLKKGMREFAALLSATDRNCRLMTANRLWVRKGFPLEKLLRQSYRDTTG